MDDTLKRIRTYTIIAITIMILESLAGFSALYTGLFYTEYDEEAATETLAAIQETDPNYFTILNDPEQPEFMEEFERLHTNKGNMPLILIGSAFIIVSILTMIPSVLIMLSVSSELKDDNAEDKEQEEEVKEDDSF